MRLHLSRLFKSKKTALTLLLLLFFSVVLLSIIPQQFSTTPAKLATWQQAHQPWLPTIEALGLHHLLTTPWFAVILFLFLVTLAIATQTQFRISYQKTFAPTVVPDATNPVGKKSVAASELSLPEEALTQILKKNGYLNLGGNQGKMRRYLKHPWGHWGIFFLHLGIFISITASLIFAVGAKRGAIRLIEGETHLPTAPWLYEERGLLAGPFFLPEAVRLDKIIAEFWEQGGVKKIRSGIRFISPQGQVTTASIATTPITTYRGMRVYQESSFGNAFYVWLTGSAGNSHGVVLDIASPVTPGKASYGNFTFPEIPYTIKAKYYADAEKKSLVSDNPLLFLRLVEQNKVIGELSLTKGESGSLGPYQAKFVRVAQWTNFTFMTTPGITGVFCGFFIFSLGGLLYYFTIPRELYCQKTDDGFRLLWKCSRFRQHYQEECQSIIKSLKKMETV